MKEDYALKIVEMSKSYPGVRALDRVSLCLKPATIHAIVGENGAGKSTLIKIISGAISPDEGNMFLFGEKYDPRNPREAFNAGVATIYQELNMLEHRNVLFNVFLGKECSRFGFLDLKNMARQTKEVLSLLNAGHISPYQVVEDLRVSQKQIIEICKALINKTKLLIMDEPTSALSAKEVEALFEIILNLKQNGVTVIYVSHKLDEILEIADYISVLRDGKHIKTYPKNDASKDKIITDMTGQSLSNISSRHISPQEDVVIEVKGLSSGNVFCEISFKVHRGEVLGITGLSGSGITELAKCLVGDFPITSGEIFFESNRIYRPSPELMIKLGFGYLPEDRKLEGVIQGLSVKRNVVLPLIERLKRILGLLDQNIEEQIALNQIKRLRIKTPSTKQIVAYLSGGNQQKVSIAKWLAINSKFLVLVEPTQGVDIAARVEIYDIINNLAQNGISFLLISSDIQEILSVSNRIIVMREGKQVAEVDAQKTSYREILRYAMGA